jgi:transcriptional regulator with XRE-family HTH domain
VGHEVTRFREFGEFLRARREQLRPEDVGLPRGERRRTPGLRREEVAVLADVSVDYLNRLEQGRDLKPSAAVINALADALRMTDEERAYFAHLAIASGAPELCRPEVRMVGHVAPNVRAIIDGLDPTPAFLTDPASRVLAGNQAWRNLVAPLGLLDDDVPALAAYVFADPRARDAFVEWARVADDQADRLRVASVRWGRDPAFASVLEGLREIPEFARRWESHGVRDHQRGMTLLRHPDVGDLRLRYETLRLPDDGEQRLTTWFPADEASESALRLTAPATTLRVVRPA